MQLQTIVKIPTSQSNPRDNLGRFARGISLSERFEKKYQVNKEGCWIWVSRMNPYGYGVLTDYPIDGYHEKRIQAHRFAYEKYRGKIPEGLVIDHLCRNRACVNPWHLEITTAKTNILRGMGISAKEAKQTHCKRGHPFSQDNTYLRIRKDGSVHRDCRECHRITRRKNWRGDI